jgi:MraZ protein
VESAGGAGVLALKRKMEHMFFLGQFYHTLDEKGRLTVPARFRESLLAEGGYIMQGFDQNLMVLPSSTFETFSHRINKMSLTDPTSRLLRRLLFSTAYHAEFDKAGRILIPQFLRQSAALESDVVFVGSGDYFEIWSAEQWTSQAEQLQDAQLNAHRFAALDLSSE